MLSWSLNPFGVQVVAGKGGFPLRMPSCPLVHQKLRYPVGLAGDLPSMVPTCTSKIFCSHQTLPAPGLAGPCAPQDPPLYFSAPLT